MMTKNEFMNYEAAKVLDYVPAEIRDILSVEPVTVVKMNDQKLNGLRFMMDKNAPCPTHYLDDAYEMYQDGLDPDVIAERTAEIWAEASRNTPVAQTSNEALDFEGKDLALRVLDTRLNKEFLKEVPYMSVGNGLALVCDVRVGEHEGGFFSTIVNNNVLEMMGRDKNDVFRQALNDSWRIDTPVLHSMQERLFGDPDNLLETGADMRGITDMYILSNNSGIHGAAALFYPEVQEKIAEVVGQNYYALPSSTEEFIIVPEEVGMSPRDLTAMVRDANRTVVSPAEKLSDNVLKYDRADRKLHDVTADRELGSRVSEMRC